MPLTGRDANTQRDVHRNKRHSTQPELAHARLKDENSPSLRGVSTKASPPSQRLLAPTKASAAKISSAPPRATGNTTPQPHSSTKLPRRTPTPTTTPSAAKLTARVAEQTTAADKGVKKGGASSRHVNAEMTHKPLPADKPLPSRPVVSFVNALSPTKHGRSLLDASEHPLFISVGGDEHAWPTLTPRFTTPPMTELQKDIKPEEPRQFSTTLSSTAAVKKTGLSRAIVGKPSISASESGHLADSERSSSPASAYNAGASVGIDDTLSGTTFYDALEDNDNGQPDDSATMFSTLGANSKKPQGFAEYTKRGLIASDDARPHSPSPASFSRPRPSSLSHARNLPSPAPTISTASSAKIARAQKTASRIPIPDSKKATLVEIKSRRSSGTVTPRSEQSPSFGTRRLDAPDTLKILDHGIKRRQLKRTDTDGTATTATSSSTKTLKPLAAPILDHSRCSSPDGTFDPSSSDEEEIVTPVDKRPGFQPSTLQIDYTVQHSDSYYHNAAVKLFDGAVAALGNAPPSNSPFTGPLQTIPSQYTLPHHKDEAAPPVPTHQSKPSDFATLMKRFSDLHAAYADHNAHTIGNSVAVSESTRNSMIELLNEYASEDDRMSKQGCAALDNETRKHITRTLSLLEGKGSPPKMEVDNETLLQMFGHLRRGLEKAPKVASFVKNVTAAERFLAQPEYSASQSQRTKMEPHMMPYANFANLGNGENVRRDHDDKPRPQLLPIEPVLSKWSNSTTSDKRVSPVVDNISPRNTIAAAPSIHPKPPKRSPPEPPRSIGYPSRVPAKANALIGPGESGAATPPNPVRRISSPTLGKRKPGSVRAARETLHQVRGGFARSTASVESKKTVKMPTPNTRPLSIVNEDQRGRIPSAEKPRSRSDGAAPLKTPRARSKSKYVLDKINGLFSGKRDRRHTPAPPIPSIDEKFTVDRDVEVAPNGSPALKATPSDVKHLMLSPSKHPAFRSTSRSTTDTSVETPVDSVTANDEQQALQTWHGSFVKKAHRQSDMARKERMLTFAKVINDSLLSAKEAQIQAEKAQQAARLAQHHFHLTQKSVEMLQRLAASLNHGGRS